MADSARVPTTDTRDIYNRLARLEQRIDGAETYGDSILLTFANYKTELKINQQTGRFEIWVNGTLRIFQ